MKIANWDLDTWRDCKHDIYIWERERENVRRRSARWLCFSLFLSGLFFLSSLVLCRLVLQQLLPLWSTPFVRAVLKIILQHIFDGPATNEFVELRIFCLGLWGRVHKGRRAANNRVHTSSYTDLNASGFCARKLCFVLISLESTISSATYCYTIREVSFDRSWRYNGLLWCCQTLWDEPRASNCTPHSVAGRLPQAVSK